MAYWPNLDSVEWYCNEETCNFCIKNGYCKHDDEGDEKMTWNELVDDFERICVLKTCLYYRIDENYLTLDDLLQIREIAHVELEIIRLLPIDEDDLHGTLSLWKAQVHKKFKELQEKMYGGR